MEEERSPIWIVIGVIAAVAVIYFVIGKPFSKSGEITSRTGETSNTETNPAKKKESEIESLAKLKLNAIPGSPDAPQQSNPISSKEEVKKEAIKISMSGAGFLPAVFSVKQRTPVTLVITSGDAQSHVFKFDSEALSGIAVGLGPKETRSISFLAPAAGEYSFSCGVLGHKARGETGTMIVQ